MLKLILSASMYSRIRDLHEGAEIEMINQYITSLAEYFYTNHLHSSNLTRNICNSSRSILQL